jgi:hypothetical protein
VAKANVLSGLLHDWQSCNDLALSLAEDVRDYFQPSWGKEDANAAQTVA